jgi:hypothetical protein
MHRGIYEDAWYAVEKGVKGVEAAGQEKDSDKWTDAEKKKSKV